MGYDMRFVATPPDEAGRVAEVGKLFYAACDLRQSDAPPANSSERYKAAQVAVDALYKWMGIEEASYFRLNIWGMGRYATAMEQLGMLYGSRSPGWPDPDAYKGDAGVDLWWDTVAHVEDGEPRPDRADDALIGRAAKYAEECARVRRYHPDGGDAIPSHKFGSNDGWLVTPAEIRAALAAYRATPTDAVDQALAEHIGDGERRDYWNRWIDYLSRAVDHDGFRVW